MAEMKIRWLGSLYSLDATQMSNPYGPDGLEINLPGGLVTIFNPHKEDTWMWAIDPKVGENSPLEGIIWVSGQIESAKDFETPQEAADDISKLLGFPAGI